jgi:hypothetical protein
MNLSSCSIIMDLSSYPAGWTGAAVLQGRVEKLFRRNVFCPLVGFDQAVEQNGAEWTVQGGGGGDVSPGTAELHDLAAQNQVGAGIPRKKHKKHSSKSPGQLFEDHAGFQTRYHEGFKYLCAFYITVI